MSNVSWSAPTSTDTAYRRAAGRRRYNSVRQLEAALRRVEVLAGLRRYGWVHGVQARLARKLGVSEATISRDVAWLMFDQFPCELCGSPVSRRRWKELERRGRAVLDER